jgi:hypothetical protein
VLARSKEEKAIMKYLLLVYGAESAWTQEERMSCMQSSVELCHELNAKQQYLGASPLHSVTTATSIRNEGGKKLVTDGPFAETHEQLGGYYLVDARDLDEAIGIAARVPVAHVGTIEIRPVMEIPGLPGQGEPR